MSAQHPVTVVVPMYRQYLDQREAVSLKSICRELAGRRIVVVHPRGIDPNKVLPVPLETMPFDREMFRGIRGYNRLMTSAEFYSAFADSEYILIAQLDTYIFRDDLDKWMSQGYDYVGAPWLQRPINKLWPVRWFKAWQDRRRTKRGLYSKTALYDRVGNGGLSLRRVASFLKVCTDRADELMELNQQGAKGFPEDVFWSTRVDGFHYPTAQEALMFSFDKYPCYCYRLTNHRLPLGCHAWYSRKMRRFWNKILPSE